jgi:hypothetical protein
MVDWGFANILAQLLFLDFRSVMKVFMSPMAKYYVVGTLLVNVQT